MILSTLSATKQCDGEDVFSCILFTDSREEDTLVEADSNCVRLINWQIKLINR